SRRYLKPTAMSTECLYAKDGDPMVRARSASVIAILSISRVPPTGITRTPEAAATSATSANTSRARRRSERYDRSLPSCAPPMAPKVVVTQLMASLDQRTPARSSTTWVKEQGSSRLATGSGDGPVGVERPSERPPLEVRW